MTNPESKSYQELEKKCRNAVETLKYAIYEFNNALNMVKKLDIKVTMVSGHPKGGGLVYIHSGDQVRITRIEKTILFEM